jgi:hypothetical protein
MTDEGKAAEFVKMAAEMRARAQEALSSETREAFEDIANQYELMAKQALAGLPLKDMRGKT